MHVHKHASAPRDGFVQLKPTCSTQAKTAVAKKSKLVAEIEGLKVSARLEGTLPSEPPLEAAGMSALQLLHKYGGEHARRPMGLLLAIPRAKLLDTAARDLAAIWELASNSHDAILTDAISRDGWTID